MAGEPLVLPGATNAEWPTYSDDWVDAVFAQPWTCSGERLGFRPRYRWQDTLAAALAEAGDDRN